MTVLTQIIKYTSIFIIGGSLSVSGLIMQTVFKNPLIDPYTTGISSCTSFFMILFSSYCIFGLANIPVISTLVGATIIYSIMLVLSKWNGNRSNDSLILIGMSSNIIFSTMTTILMYVQHSSAIKEIISLLIGDTRNIHVGNTNMCVTTILVVTLYIVYKNSNVLDLLLHSEIFARSNGLNVGIAKKLLILSCILMSAVCVSMIGPIGFIGIIIPNIAKICFSIYRHRVLIPICVISGGIFLIISDVLIHIVDRNMSLDMPTGSVISLIGSLLLILILIRYKNMKNV